MILFGSIIMIFVILIGVVIMSLFTWFALKKSYEPEVCYGEFPFKLTYEINGESITIEDVYVCEYDGIGWDTGRLMYRKWKGYYKSSGEQNLLIYSFSDNNKKVGIYCSIGGPKYYMNDVQNNTSIDVLNPFFYTITESGNLTETSYNIDDVVEKYSLKITDCELSEPIENNFEK